MRFVLKWIFQLFLNMSRAKYSTVKQKSFFVQGPISFQIGVAKNLQLDMYYVYIKRNFIYHDKHGSCKASENTVYLSVPAAAELVKQFEPALRFATTCFEKDRCAQSH